MPEAVNRQASRATPVDPGAEPAEFRAAAASENALHRIIVVGGGAAGLELVTRLGDRLGRRARASVTLVERCRTHLWKPLLHAVAAGSIDPGEYEVNYLAQAHWHGFRYCFGEMIGIDRAAKQVCLGAAIDDEGREITPPRSIGYDMLVIAIGSITNDFGTPGVAEHAVPLETPNQARRFNRRLLNACIRAQTQDGPVRPGQLHVAIVGAGATGAELAAELHRTTREVISYGRAALTFFGTNCSAAGPSGCLGCARLDGRRVTAIHGVLPALTSHSEQHDLSRHRCLRLS